MPASKPAEFALLSCTASYNRFVVTRIVSVFASAWQGAAGQWRCTAAAWPACASKAGDGQAAGRACVPQGASAQHAPASTASRAAPAGRARQAHARRAPQPRVRQQRGVQHADVRVHPRIAALGEGPALGAVRRVHERGRVDGVVQQHSQHVPLRPRPRSQGGEPGRGDKVVTRSQGESGRGEPGRHCRHPTAFAPAP